MPYDVAGFEITPKPMTVADVLNRAADLIEERGHELIGYTNPRGGLCMYGAIVTALGQPKPSDLPMDDPEFSLYASATNRLNDYIGHVAKYNATHTAAEVISALRAAASAS